MTLLLKTNVRAQNNIGNVHGMQGPMDYTGMLDFSRGDYYTMIGGVRRDYNLAEAVAVARLSDAPYEIRSGGVQTVPANTPRIHYLRGYDTEGLLVHSASVNLATSGADGTTVALPPATERVVLSYLGGTAALVSGDLTEEEAYTLPNGRKAVRYIRSTNSPFNVTLEQTGATDILVESSNTGPSVFFGYATAVVQETATLLPPFSDLVSGTDCSIVMRVIAMPSGTVSGLIAGRIIAAQSANPFGGAYFATSRSKTNPGTDAVQAQVDGGSNNPDSRAQLSGNWNDSYCVGMCWSGLGDVCGVISYGQYAEKDGLGAIFSAPQTVTIGGVSGMFGGNHRVNGIITHVVIYPRKLARAEAEVLANQWL